MRKIRCLLFVLKRSYICYYIICMTAHLMGLDLVQNLKAQFQAVAELWRFMFSSDLVNFCNFFFLFFLFVYLTVGVFSKGYCLIYRQGQGMKLQRQVLYQVNILYQINFRSCHDSRRLKIMAQNHTNFCHAKIIGYSKGSKKI